MAAVTEGKEGEDQVPYLSFNPKVSPQARVMPEVSAEELAKMQKVDPKLPHTWVLWEQLVRKSDKAQYSDFTHELCKWKTVKDFWASFNHLPQPSELLDGKKFMREEKGEKQLVDALMIFREGVRPEWEAPENVNGGHFQLQLTPKLGGGVVDELWNNCVLGIISGCVEPAHMIMGIRLVDKLNAKNKPCVRIEVWFNKFDEGEVGSDMYDLRGSFERCLRQGLDGKQGRMTWDTTEVKPHSNVHTVPGRK